ncbi:MAG: SDR family oxidoreductase [Ignavibacteriaceae bacterium]|nr:SDR family oxidoreductase [Ignavibacteriaceae bacterium]
MSKKYLIVGGSSGIGLALTNRLATEGNKVIVLSRNKNRLELNDNIEHHKFDVLDPSENLPAFEQEINGLAYCPGSINLKPFKSFKEQEYIDDFRINALGAVKVINQYLTNLKKSEKSSIVLFSTVAVQTGMPYHASIAMAKGAVEGLTRSLAAEFAPKIRVNAIASSLTNTPLAVKLLSSDEKKEASAKRHPLNSIGKAEDIANAAFYLLSEESGWVTGQILHVDGGMSSIRLL